MAIHTGHRQCFAFSIAVVVATPNPSILRNLLVGCSNPDVLSELLVVLRVTSM